MSRYDDLEARRAARDSRATRYTPSEPCKRGHISERYTCNGGCVECAQEFKITKATATQRVIKVEWVVRVGLNGDINALKVYLTNCFVAFFESQGEPNVLERHKLAEMRATGTPYADIK